MYVTSPPLNEVISPLPPNLMCQIALSQVSKAYKYLPPPILEFFNDFFCLPPNFCGVKLFTVLQVKIMNGAGILLSAAVLQSLGPLICGP